MTIVGLKRLNKVILAPILAPSFFKFWKRYSQIFTFFYVRAEHHWKKARARWAAFRTELANTGKNQQDQLVQQSSNTDFINVAKVRLVFTGTKFNEWNLHSIAHRIIKNKKKKEKINNLKHARS